METPTSSPRSCTELLAIAAAGARRMLGFVLDCWRDSRPVTGIDNGCGAPIASVATKPAIIDARFSLGLSPSDDYDDDGGMPAFWLTVRAGSYDVDFLMRPYQLQLLADEIDFELGKLGLNKAGVPRCT